MRRVTVELADRHYVELTMAAARHPLGLTLEDYLYFAALNEIYRERQTKREDG